jgi:hypothetical protein
MQRIKGIVALISFTLLVFPVMAAINDIPAGGTVFIGEQGLDITAGLGANNQIAWFPSTATMTSTTPEKVIDVTATKTSFYASPTDFSSWTGNWYSWAPGLTAGTATLCFRVDEPYVALKVRDTTVGVDVTPNKWIYRGDTAQFRIETNLYAMTGRGLAGAPVTINVQSPDGAIYSSLRDPAGTPQSLEISVPSSPYDVPGVLWDTGNSMYSPGTYTIWVECNANSMKDNYPSEGKTVSSRLSMQITEFNPLIKTATATATTLPATSATTKTQAVPIVTTTVMTPPAITTIIETTTAPPSTVEETVTAPPTPVPAPTRTYADGFTAIVSAAAVCAAAALLSGRFR